MNAMPNNLPYQLSSFIGRGREMADVKRLLVSSRLVTLIGAGGCGKTSLALHIAQAVLDGYADGVWWVELAPLSDAALLPQTVMKALSLVEQRGRSPLATLLDFLKETDLLLILDNCEHVIDAAARLVDDLLQGGAGLRMLATSREALNIAGELAWIVPSLQVPDASALPMLSNLQQCDSVQLFVEAIRNDFVHVPFKLLFLPQVLLTPSIDGKTNVSWVRSLTVFNIKSFAPKEPQYLGVMALKEPVEVLFHIQPLFDPRGLTQLDLLVPSRPGV